MAESKKPNIICFVMDQLRYDYLGCMGNTEIDTPNIDKLARTGVTFDRAYVANPLCMPARASLFTGRTPRGHRVRTNGIPLDENIPTLPQALKDAGYRTHSVGKLHLHNFGVPNDLAVDEDDPLAYPERRKMWLEGKIKSLPEPYYGLETTDFVGGHVFGVFGDYLNWLKDEYPEKYKLFTKNHPDNKFLGSPQTYLWGLPQELHYNHWISDQTINFLEEEGKQDKPFFLWCSYPDPHHPYVVLEPWGSMYDPEEVSLGARREEELEELPDFYKDAYKNKGTALSGLQGKAEVRDKELKKMIAVTYGMISFVDNEIGRVMKKVEKLGLREDTVIVFLSDHGDMMGDHWMVRKGPFQYEGLLRMPFIFSWPDNFPSGIRTSGLASQIDFAPTILDLCNVPIPEGPTPNIQEAPKAPDPWPGNSLKLQLKGKKDKVNEHVIVENDEDYLGLRIRTFITERYKMTLHGGGYKNQLFDLKNDPDELNNLWDDNDYKDVKYELYKKFLEAYIHQDSALPRRMSHA